MIRLKHTGSKVQDGLVLYKARGRWANQNPYSTSVPAYGSVVFLVSDASVTVTV